MYVEYAHLQENFGAKTWFGATFPTACPWNKTQVTRGKHYKICVYLPDLTGRLGRECHILGERATSVWAIRRQPGGHTCVDSTVLPWWEYISVALCNNLFILNRSAFCNITIPLYYLFNINIHCVWDSLVVSHTAVNYACCYNLPSF
jgi:hypothetical protein